MSNRWFKGNSNGRGTSLRAATLGPIKVSLGVNLLDLGESGVPLVEAKDSGY